MTNIKLTDGEEVIVFVTFNDKFADCWNVYIEDDICSNPYLLSMSDNPSHPQGVFSNHENVVFNLDDALERGEVMKEWKDLPSKCVSMVYNWLGY